MKCDMTKLSERLFVGSLPREDVMGRCHLFTIEYDIVIFFKLLIVMRMHWVSCGFLENAPYYCTSVQMVWGHPIMVFSPLKFIYWINSLPKVNDAVEDHCIHSILNWFYTSGSVGH